MLQITPSERRALQLLADERSASEIASCLGIAVSDVRSHLAVLFAKMGVSTKDEAVSDASRRGCATISQSAGCVSGGGWLKLVGR
jgi:DNA-binding CsgD family transcriptional regulator